MKTSILSNKVSTSGKFMAALCGAFMFAAIPSALAQNLWQNTNPLGGDWHDAGNWSLGNIPTSGNETQINNGGLAIINGSSAAARGFIIGNNTAGNRLEVLGSSFVTRGVTLGNSAGGVGSVRLASETNWITDGSGTLSAFVVGLGGSGSLLIESGATLHSGRTRIAINAGSAGEATVRGTWIWESSESVGLITGGAILNLGAGGKVSLTGTTQTVTMGAGSTFNIGGKTTAEAAGRLNAASVNGTGAAPTINFNHTDTNYIFETETNAPIAITGTTRVNQVSGTTTLTAVNTYTGATSVTGGTLLVNGSLSASSAVTVSEAGTLGGSGSVGNVTVDGTLAPGSNGVGILSTGNVSLTSTATLEYFLFNLPHIEHDERS